MTLENLLNTLIQRGWKPFGLDAISISKYNYHKLDKIGGGIEEVFDIEIKFITQETVVYSRRDIVSKESGLWRFVTYKKMVDKKKIGKYYEMILDDNGIDAKDYRPFGLEEGLIIESALKDESELEDFLLQNIKVEG